MAASINYIRALLNLPESNPKRAGRVSGFQFESKIHAWGQHVSSEMYALQSGLYFIGYNGPRFVWGIVFRGGFEHEIEDRVLSVTGKAHIMEYSKLCEHGSGNVAIEWEFKDDCDPGLSEAFKKLSDNLAQNRVPSPCHEGLFEEEAVFNFANGSNDSTKDTKAPCEKVKMRELIRKDQSIIITLRGIKNEDFKVRKS